MEGNLQNPEIIIQDNDRKNGEYRDVRYLKELERIVEASKNPGQDIIFYPESFTQRIKRDSNDINSLINVQEKNGKAWITTGNFAGMLQCGDVKVRVGSRFDSKEGAQLFLTYMLASSFEGMVFPDEVTMSSGGGWDLILIFCFMAELQKAFRKGLFKRYRSVNHNDFSLKGFIDFPHHVKKNIPFLGKTAYRTRDYTYDNAVLWLIRHTANYIACQNPGLWHAIMVKNKTFREAITIIRTAAPSYSPRQQYHIYHECLKPIQHPFYSEYERVRKLCLQILRKEAAQYDSKSDKVTGFVFDIAWLWEKFVYKELVAPLQTIYSDWSVKHTDSVFRENPISLFEAGKRKIYPDYLLQKVEKGVEDQQKVEAILDAKYKPGWNEEYPSHREDIYQVLTYMYITTAKYGGIIYPVSEKEYKEKKKIRSKIDTKFSELTNEKYFFYKFPFIVPKFCCDKPYSYNDFKNRMQQNIEEWRNKTAEIFLQE